MPKQDSEAFVKKLADYLSHANGPTENSNLNQVIARHDLEIVALKESITQFQKDVSDSFKKSNESISRLAADLHDRIEKMDFRAEERIGDLQRLITHESAERLKSREWSPALTLGIFSAFGTLIAALLGLILLVVSPMKDTTIRNHTEFKEGIAALEARTKEHISPDILDEIIEARERISRLEAFTEIANHEIHTPTHTKVSD